MLCFDDLLVLRVRFPVGIVLLLLSGQVIVQLLQSIKVGLELLTLGKELLDLLKYLVLLFDFDNPSDCFNTLRGHVVHGLSGVNLSFEDGFVYNHLFELFQFRLHLSLDQGNHVLLSSLLGVN